MEWQAGRIGPGCIFCGTCCFSLLRLRNPLPKRGEWSPSGSRSGQKGSQAQCTGADAALRCRRTGFTHRLVLLPDGELRKA